MFLLTDWYHFLSQSGELNSKRAPQDRKKGINMLMRGRGRVINIIQYGSFYKRQVYSSAKPRQFILLQLLIFSVNLTRFVWRIFKIHSFLSKSLAWWWHWRTGQFTFRFHYQGAIYVFNEQSAGTKTWSTILWIFCFEWKYPLEPMWPPRIKCVRKIQGY